MVNFFSRKKQNPDYPRVNDFSSLHTEFHSHLVPAIDDGVKSIEESVQMIKELHALGFKKVITTPHIMSDFYKNTPETIFGGLEKVRDALKKENIPVILDAAAEYYMDTGLLDKLSKEKLLTFGKNYLLFELSYINPPDNLQTFIFEMQVNGYNPIIAHPERYFYWEKKFEEYYKLKEKGVLFQLNTNSLCGYYGPTAKIIAAKMIDEGMIDFIGSDCHGERHMAAMKKTLNEKLLWKLFAKGLRNAEL